MTNIQLIEAQCRIEQVQTVLGFWLEGASPSNRDKLMIGAVIWCDKSRYMTSHVVLVVITTF